jgi:hypothetical protein
MSLLDEAGRTGVVEAVERIINREGEADTILRLSVEALAERIEGLRGASLAFVEPGGMAVGPTAGEAPPRERPATSEPVVYRHAVVAELWIDAPGEPDHGDRALLRRLADLLSPYCLVGWDVGGEEWTP